jgi:hypothetical protein
VLAAAPLARFVLFVLQQQQSRCTLADVPVLQKQEPQATAAASSWQPAWAAVGSSSTTRIALDTASPQISSVYSIQRDGSSRASATSSSDGSVTSSGSSSSSSTGMPVVTDMPPLADLLGDAAAGSSSSEQPSSSSSSDSSQQQQQQETDSKEDSPGVRAALAMLRWYKGALSPLMASTCRFLPTCSQYSMDSYR